MFWHPHDIVPFGEAPEDGSPHPVNGVGGEPASNVGVPLVDGACESNGPFLEKIFAADTAERSFTADNILNAVVNETHIVSDKFFACVVTVSHGLLEARHVVVSGDAC